MSIRQCFMTTVYTHLRKKKNGLLTHILFGITFPLDGSALIQYSVFGIQYSVTTSHLSLIKAH
jgi:hypothetical protein